MRMPYMNSPIPSSSLMDRPMMEKMVQTAKHRVKAMVLSQSALFWLARRGRLVAGISAPVTWPQSGRHYFIGRDEVRVLIMINKGPGFCSGQVISDFRPASGGAGRAAGQRTAPARR